MNFIPLAFPRATRALWPASSQYRCLFTPATINNVQKINRSANSYQFSQRRVCRCPVPAVELLANLLRRASTLHPHHNRQKTLTKSSASTSPPPPPKSRKHTTPLRRSTTPTPRKSLTRGKSFKKSKPPMKSSPIPKRKPISINLVNPGSIQVVVLAVSTQVLAPVLAQEVSLVSAVDHSARSSPLRTYSVPLVAGRRERGGDGGETHLHQRSWLARISR
jgi:hypothetical protein